MATVDVKSELKNHHLRQLSSVKETYSFEAKTPAHLFTNVIADLTDGQRYLALVARDSFDQDLASALIGFVRKHYPELRQSIPCQILSGFKYEGAKFDCILAINPNAHGLYVKESPRLHELTIEAIPIYRCEFSGDETVEILQLARRKYVDTLDWRREPSPRVWLAFSDVAMGVRSTGHKLGLTTKKDAILKVRRVAESSESWVELENYAGQHVRITFRDSGYAIESKTLKLSVTIDRSAIDEWIEHFLLIGIKSSPKASIPPKMASLSPNEPLLSVYLFDQEKDRQIDSKEPIVVGLTQALDEFDRLSDTDGSFIGFRRSDGAVLQFIWNRDRTLDADIPLPGQGGSLQQRGTWEGLRPLIEKFASRIAVRELPGFRFQPHPKQAQRP
jgi:hypothetical protein